MACFVEESRKGPEGTPTKTPSGLSAWPVMDAMSVRRSLYQGAAVIERPVDGVWLSSSHSGEPSPGVYRQRDFPFRCFRRCHTMTATKMTTPMSQAMNIVPTTLVETHRPVTYMPTS